MTDRLTPDDVDQLRDVVERLQRVAKTARRLGPANPHPVRWRLLALAAAADQFVATADALAAFMKGQTEPGARVSR